MPFSSTAGLTIHYRTGGPAEAPRVVFLNSLGTDCRIWNDVTSLVGDRLHWLAYDERGQGLTDSPPGPYSIADHADDLLALLDDVSWGPSVLCGLSIGGMIAMEAYVRRPDTVTGLVLSDTADVIGPREFWDGRIAQVRKSGLSAIAESVMERWFGSSYRHNRSAAAGGWANLLARAPVQGYIGSCFALRDADLSGSIGDIRVPALCICGSEDTSTPPSAVRSLRSRLPDANYVEIEGAGHLVPVEEPGEFATVLNRFVEERCGS